MLKVRITLVTIVAFSAFSAKPSVARSADSTQAVTRSAPERLTAETARVTPGGATFTVPSGWTIETGKSLVVLTPPESDTHVAIVDSQAADAKTAVEAAWGIYKPESKRPLKLVTPRPAREGWEERQVFDYETSPNERVVVEAIALRAGSKWTVLILDGTDPTVEKRGTPISLIFSSLRPRGYQRESFAGRRAQPLDAARIAQMKEFVETSMKELGIPGSSMALIDGGKIVYTGGFGVKELGKPDPVDENTLFMAASNTKGMTTLLLAELVDQKKLSWDEPAIEAYPSFKLGDADTTRRVLIRNLICACTGVPRQDLEWLFDFKKATPESEMALLGTMQPTSKFGEVFQYSNLMATAAGYIGGHLRYPDMELGAAYDEAMQKMVFDPLGMNSTTFDYARVLAGNHATPHGDDVDGTPSIASMDLNYSIVPARPAGGVWTSAADLAKYVQDELSLGKLPNGKQLVSSENLLARRAPQISEGEDATYGMGLSVSRKYGIPVVSHGGSMIGFMSNFFFLPDSGIGAVILTNSNNGGMLLGPFGRRLLEIVFEGKPEAAGDIASQAVRHKAELVKDRERLVIPADPAQANALAKRYTSKELGQITVLNQDGGTTFQFDGFKSKVASRKNDDGSISFITIDPGADGFEFVVGQHSGSKVLVIRDGQHEYTFNEATRIMSPTTPAAITPPAENFAFLVGHAVGTQGYVCLPTSTGASWTVNGSRPEAVLSANSSVQDFEITHFLSPNANPNEFALTPLPFGSPTWRSCHDGSVVWAKALAPSVSSGSDASCPNTGAIPCLLLQIVGSKPGPSGGEGMSPITFIQRLNTKGGSAPATGCSASTDVGKQTLVPYTADYYFFRKDK